jgi:segregation and condensation protein B
MSNLKSIVEGLIFVSDSPITFTKLCDILNEYDKEEIRLALTELRNDYNPVERGIYLAEVAEGYQFRTCKESAEFIRRLVRISTSKLSKPALETTSYHCLPATDDSCRNRVSVGVESGGVLKTLLEKSLIKIL